MRIASAILCVAAAGCFSQSTPDTSQPVVSVSPVNGAAGVRPDASIVATFAHDVQAGTVTSSSFAVTQDGAPVEGTVAVQGATATFAPLADLAANTLTLVRLTTAIRFTTGQNLAAEFSWTFTTGNALDHTPPAVVSTVPAKDATGVSPGSVVTVTFSKAMAPASITGSSFTVTVHGGAAIDGTVALSGATATFTPKAPLAYGATYDCAISTVASDLAGNALPAEYDWSFATGAAAQLAVNEIAAKVASGIAGDSNGDGATSSSQDEFVELLNLDGASSADISGYKLQVGTATKFTFPAGTTLAAGGRVVVFGGGTPTGSFGGAQTFTSSLSLTDSGATVSVVRPDASIADSITYAAAASNGASWVRSPEGTGALVAHDSIAGNTGILWSPGVATTAAIPKAYPALSTPASGANGVLLNATVTVQFNMAMSAADIANVALYAAADCSGTALAATVAAASAGLQAVLTPTAALTGDTTYCVKVPASIHSGAGTALAADVSWTFHTVAVHFDVLSATATDATHVKVSFDAPPDATAGATSTNYSISPTLAVNAAAVSGSDVTLTTDPQTASTSYTVTVSNVTRASDGIALTTNSAGFTGFVLPAFGVSGAAALSSTTVEVTFSDDYDTNSGTTAANYCIAFAADPDCQTPRLAVSAVAAGSTTRKALVTTAAQTANVLYKIYVSNVTRTSNGDALPAGANAGFAGFNLIQNGSFEADTASPPSGWTVTTSGTLAAGTGTVTAQDGTNVASFTSLTSSISGREAHSTCFPVTAGNVVTANGYLLTPTATANSRASFKLYWFTDACTTAATTASNTQSSVQLATPNTWQLNTFAPTAPTGATHAWLAIRADFVSPGTSAEQVYFDDISLQ